MPPKTVRFADFELDPSRRELRLRGREIVLQPRVFDVLAYFVDHRDDLIRKDELLDALWPDVVVADGALQRAVSLARSALRQGGMAEAIRTHSRIGYSFRADVQSLPGEPLPPRATSIPPALERARRAFDASDWRAASEAFEAADGAAALEAPDLERWGQAAQFAGKLAVAVAALERAAAAYSSAADRRGTARVAVQLANLHLERREIAVATGWRNRAATLLGREEVSREHGLLAWVSSRIAVFAGEMEEARREADRATEIGRLIEDPEVEALGLVYRGLTLLALGDTRAGVPLQDEAAATVLSGQVGPFVGGIVFCTVIWGCVNRADWQRASQWTEQFTRWCDRTTVASYPGLCRLHRAEVLTLKGELAEAERELLKLQPILADYAPFAEGDLHRVLGEVRLARGELTGAEEAFRRAYELGWDPQPGRALLQLRLGKPGAAVQSLERSLQGTGWATRQRRRVLLAHLVVVAVAAGELDRARSALAELDRSVDPAEGPAIEALVCRARAELAFAEGRRAEAIAGLRRAARIWQDVGSPLNVGGVRVRLAEFLRADGDPETAELEITAAERVFRDAGIAAAEIRKT